MKNIEDEFQKQKQAIFTMIAEDKIKIDMYIQLISSFAAAINYGAYDWDEFIRYCNTPCYRYKIK